MGDAAGSANQDSAATRCWYPGLSFSLCSRCFRGELLLIIRVPTEARRARENRKLFKFTPPLPRRLATCTAIVHSSSRLILLSRIDGDAPAHKRLAPAFRDSSRAGLFSTQKPLSF